MENDFHRIVEALPGLVWTARADGRVDFLNQRWCEYTGAGVVEAGGRLWQAAIHPEDLPGLLERWQAILASGKPGEMEARLGRFDGAYRWFLFRAGPLADATGRIVKWCGITTDIADRRQAEEALHAEERRFQLIVEGLPSQVSIRSPAGDLQHVNRKFLEYSGRTLEQLKSRSWHDTWHPDDRPASGVAWTRSLETGQPYEFEGRRRRADGVHRWFHVRGFPLRDADGRIVLWYLMHTDVDDRKRAEALLAGEKRLVEMVAGSHPMPAILDALCQVAESTASGCRCSVMLLDPGGTRLERGAIPSLSACWSMPILSKAGKVMGAFEIYYDEPRTPTSLDQSLIQQLTHIASIAIERTQNDAALARARSELARVVRVASLGALTASVAHEVNQPLSGIITNASTCLRMLAADPPNVEGACETARRTIRDGNRASDVITRLRALFSKQDATIEAVDLNDAAREVIALSLSELQRGRVILRQEFADNLPSVEGDRVQLQQVILNLLLNASDAMSGVADRPRQLVIRTEPDEDDRARLSVRDAGVGFDPQSAERMFDAFYTTKNGGMGIGLSVSRAIIESHHGRLWATPNDGPGAIFSFSIPRRSETAATGSQHLMRSV